MLVYTSITKSYLPKARVLAKSVKKFHPDWTFVLLYSDDMPSGFDVNDEPFDEVLTIDQLGIPNWKAWAFGHSIVELCTAVKGTAAEYLARRSSVDRIMYIDPDIKIFNSLSILESMLDDHEILLTPHLLDAENDINAIQDNEISALKHGIYNLGFFASRTSGQGLDFIKWWAARLRLFCRDDIPGGLFTDQRWCDLVPAFFSGLGIVRDRGFNVATWNIAHRPLSKDKNGVFSVAGVPLRFYHFTSYDSGDGFGMLMRYASDQKFAHELWDSYGQDLITEGHGDVIYKGWHYGMFDNGIPITIEARRLYLAREDLQKAFPDPFSTVEPCYLSWWNENNNSDNESSTSIKKSILRRMIHGVMSPGEGVHIARSVMVVLKHEGLTGLVKRVRNY